MKTILFFSILISASCLFGQTPDYFGNEPVWREHWTFAQSSQCIEHSDKQIYISGDSTMTNGKSYKILNATTYNWEMSFGDPLCDDPAYYDSEIYGFVRQSNDSIFEYRTSEDEEVLAFHYNLNIGDTLQGAFYYDNWSEPVHVTDIDSIQTLSGYHRRFSVYPEFSSSPEYLVEGIGSSFGFLSGLGIMLNGTRNFLCYRQNGEFQYGYETDCTVISSISEFGLTPLILYPNPSASRIITIEFDQLVAHEISNISLYSLDGKKCSQFQHLDQIDNHLVLDLEGLEAGIYILEMQSKDRFGQSKLILE